MGAIAPELHKLAIDETRETFAIPRGGKDCRCVTDDLHGFFGNRFCDHGDTVPPATDIAPALRADHLAGVEKFSMGGRRSSASAKAGTGPDPRGGRSTVLTGPTPGFRDVSGIGVMALDEGHHAWTRPPWRWLR